MDDSILEGSDECSSKESGWTKYIASSPEHEDHHDNYDDDDDKYGGIYEQKGSKKDDDDDDDVESDDSMASDASSGPIRDRQNRGLLININRGLGHDVVNKNEKIIQMKKPFRNEKMKQLQGKRIEAATSEDRSGGRRRKR